MARLSGKALRITVFVGETDQVHHRPLYTEIVHRAHAAGMAGASVLRGVEGYGATNHIHTTRWLSLSGDLPMVIVIVDTPEKVQAFLPGLEELVTQGLVILDEVEVVRYVGRASRASQDGDRLAEPEEAGWQRLGRPRNRP